MELALTEFKTQSINIKNKKEIVKELKEKLVKYDKVLTVETLSEGKDDRSTLNKLKKAIEDSRKSVKKECLKPYEEVEKDFKEITGLLDEAIIKLDTQIKTFEDKEREDKLLEIVKYFDEKENEYKEFINFDKIFNEQWLNKTFTIKKVQMDIDHIFAKTKMDIELLESNFKDEVILKQAKLFYFDNINESAVLSLTMQRINEINEFNEKMVQAKDENIKQVWVPLHRHVQENDELYGRSFKVICNYEKLVKLNDFLVNNNYNFELIEKFEVKEEE